MSTNNQSVAAVNINNAPQDISKLSLIGRFQLRRLAEELTRNGIPMVDTDERRSAFMALPDAQAMATAVAEGLKKYREASGISVPQEEEKPRATSSQEELAAAVIPPVEEVPVEAKPKRSPRTSASIKSSMVEAAAKIDPDFIVVNQAADNTLLTAIAATKALAESISDTFSGIEKQINNQNTSIGAQGETIRDLYEKISILETKLNTALGFLTIIGENVLNTSQYQAIKAAQEVAEDEDFLPKAREKSRG